MKRLATYLGVAILLLIGTVASLEAGPECGNRVLDPGETCDPPEPDSSAPDRCRSDCKYCGDGGIPDFLFEACDDGNNIDGDGCESDCYRLTHVDLLGNDVTGDGTQTHPFRTIQRAFEQAGSFYTILVGPGTYNECVIAGPPVAADRPVKILARSWIESADNTSTSISGSGVCDRAMDISQWAPVVDIASHESRIEGFSISGGGGGGILAAGSVAITNNVITDNRSTSGGGIHVDLTTADFGAVEAEVRDNEISDNTADGHGGGIYVSAVGLGDTVDVLIDSNDITGNESGATAGSDANGGGLGVLTNSTASGDVRVAVTRNTISGNNVTLGASGYSGGAWVSTFGFGTETIDIAGNTFEDNVASVDGGGLSAWISTAGTRGDADPQTSDTNIQHTVNVTDNVFLDNAASNGGGMDLFLFAQNLKDDESARIDAARNVVTGNDAFGGVAAFGGGGGVQVLLTSWRSATPDTWIRLEDNSIRSNTAAVSGGGIGIVIEADADPPDDDSMPLPVPAFAAGRVDMVRNLIADNDASAPFAGGGGTFAYLKAFVDATATLNVDQSTIAGNLADFGAGGILIETFTGFDNPPTTVGVADLNISNSIISGNDVLGIGGPVPNGDFGGILAPGASSGNTGNLRIDVSYSDVFGHPDGNYDQWIVNPTGQNGNISADPLFDSQWFVGSCSPTIDAADPALDFSLEPAPNGARANMGHNGTTALAVSALVDPSGDDVVDGIDILQLSVAFGAAPSEPRFDPLVDFNADGMVDGDDLTVVAGNFGVSCP